MMKHILIILTVLGSYCVAFGADNRVAEIRRTYSYQINNEFVPDKMKSCVITPTEVFIERTEYAKGTAVFTTIEKTNISVGSKSIDFLNQQIAEIDSSAQYQNGEGNISGPQSTYYDTNVFRAGQAINIYYTEPSAWQNELKRKFRKGTIPLFRLLESVCTSALMDGN
jgi:hypothetical protein